MPRRRWHCWMCPHIFYRHRCGSEDACVWRKSYIKKREAAAEAARAKLAGAAQPIPFTPDRSGSTAETKAPGLIPSPAERTSELADAIARLDHSPDPGKMVADSDTLARAAIAAAQEWRPIETAPRDRHASYLGYVPIYDIHGQPAGEPDANDITIIWWEQKVGDGGAWLHEATGKPCKPTHWMPLPPPPRRAP